MWMSFEFLFGAGNGIERRLDLYNFPPFPLHLSVARYIMFKQRSLSAFVWNPIERALADIHAVRLSPLNS